VPVKHYIFVVDFEAGKRGHVLAFFSAVNMHACMRRLVDRFDDLATHGPLVTLISPRSGLLVLKLDSVGA
jgi:hypothetical protein